MRTISYYKELTISINELTSVAPRSSASMFELRRTTSRRPRRA